MTNTLNLTERPFSTEVQQKIDQTAVWWEEQGLPPNSWRHLLYFITQATANIAEPEAAVFDVVEQLQTTAEEWYGYFSDSPYVAGAQFQTILIDRRKTALTRRMIHRQDDHIFFHTMSDEKLAVPPDVADAIAPLSEWEFFLLQVSLKELVNSNEIYFGLSSPEALLESPPLAFLATVNDSLPESCSVLGYPFWWQMSPIIRREMLLTASNWSHLLPGEQVGLLTTQHHEGAKGIVTERFRQAGDITTFLGKRLHQLMQMSGNPSGFPSRRQPLAEIFKNFPPLPTVISANGVRGPWLGNLPPEYFPHLQAAFELLKQDWVRKLIVDSLDISFPEQWHEEHLFGAPDFAAAINTGNDVKYWQYIAAAMLMLKNLMGLNGNPETIYQYLEQTFPGMRLPEVELGEQVTVDMMILPQEVAEILDRSGYPDPTKAWYQLSWWEKYALSQGVTDPLDIHLLEIKTILRFDAQQWTLTEQGLKGIPGRLLKQFVNHIAAAHFGQFSLVRPHYHVLRVDPSGMTLLRDVQDVLADQVMEQERAKLEVQHVPKQMAIDF